MSVETTPGADSPIDAIKAIQQERTKRRALGIPGQRKLVCSVYLKGQPPNTELEVDTCVPQDALLKVLGAAYLAIRDKTPNGTPIEVPKSAIIVP